MSHHGERRADTRTVDSGGTRGLLLGLVSLVALTFSWPNGTTTQAASAVGMLTALGLATAAIVLAVRALARTQGPDAVAPGAISAIITGTITCVMAVLLLLVLALMWSEFGALCGEVVADEEIAYIDASLPTACAVEARDGAGADIEGEGRIPTGQSTTERRRKDQDAEHIVQLGEPEKSCACAAEDIHAIARDARARADEAQHTPLAGQSIGLEIALAGEPRERSIDRQARRQMPRGGRSDAYVSDVELSEPQTADLTADLDWAIDGLRVAPRAPAADDETNEDESTAVFANG